jgi:Ni,Fe-hydrogenase III small subunit
VNCEITFIELENFYVTAAVTKRVDEQIHTVYVVAGNPRVTVARASGRTPAEAMERLLEVTSA